MKETFVPSGEKLGASPPLVVNSCAPPGKPLGISSVYVQDRGSTS